MPQLAVKYPLPNSQERDSSRVGTIAQVIGQQIHLPVLFERPPILQDNFGRRPRHSKQAVLKVQQHIALERLALIFEPFLPSDGSRALFALGGACVARFLVTPGKPVASETRSCGDDRTDCG